MRESKIALRTEFLGRRNLMPKEEMASKSRAIKEKIENLEIYKKSKTAMFYVSFNNEVETHGLIKNALGKKTVVVPKVANHQIVPSLIIDFDSLVPTGKFGILEPIELMKISEKNIGLIFVPGACFDKNGYRLGFGFGHYDKFLAKVQKAVKIGLAYDFQLIDEIPAEEHDIPLDMVATEKRVVECRK